MASFGRRVQGLEFGAVRGDGLGQYRGLND